MPGNDRVLAGLGGAHGIAFRRYVRREAAAIGGLLYGFSPFMFAQATDHPQVTLALFPALALLLLDEMLVRQRRSAVRVGVLLGFATAVQLMTGQKIAAATVLVAAIGVALLALLHRDAGEPRTQPAR